MPNINQLIVAVVVVVVVVVGIFLFSTGKIAPTETSVEEQTEAVSTLSLAGQVVLVDVENNSFVMTDQQTGQEFTVQVGAETEFIRLTFPFDPASPPEDLETFVPEREDVTIQELIEEDFVFVRSSHEVQSGDVIVDPLEIQILP